MKLLLAIAAAACAALLSATPVHAGMGNCGVKGPCPTQTLPPSPSPTATPTTSSASPAPSPTAAPTATGLTLDDEFGGSSLGSVWGTSSHWTGLSEATADRSMLSVANGMLEIKATRVNGVWHAGELDTFGRFAQTYGHFEARLRFTSGKGLWPAFWLAHDWSGDISELDVDETLANPWTGSCGDNSGSYFATVHLSSGSMPEGSQRYCSGTDLANAWHVYAMDWRSDHITFSIDGVAWHTYAGVIPNTPEVVIANLAVGGWAGASDSTTPDPSYVWIDYVRVSP